MQLDVVRREHSWWVVSREVGPRDLCIRPECRVSREWFVECREPKRIKHTTAQGLTRGRREGVWDATHFLGECYSFLDFGEMLIL